MRQLKYKDFLLLLNVHRPFQITPEHVNIAAKHEDWEDEEFLDRMVADYPSCEARKTGGYIFPGEILPWRFRDRIIVKASDMSRHGRENGLIDEVLCNSWEHGVCDEKGRKKREHKNIYLLWHHCCGEKEFYVIDEGEIEFDLQERLDIRNRFVASFGKDLISTTDMLYGRTKEFEYFNIIDDKKKGTLVRFVLKQPFGKKEINNNACHYMGHQLLL